MKIRSLWPVLWLLVGGVGGCVNPPCPKEHMPLETLVAQHNENAAKVDRLWARASLRVELQNPNRPGRVTWGSSSPLASPNGYVMLAKRPGAAGNDFVLMGREASVDLFRAGVDSAGGLYYFWYHLGKEGKAWFGRTSLAGTPSATDIRIDPLQLMEILQVTDLPAGGSEADVVMTMQTRPCAYVVKYLKPQPGSGQMKAWREVYFRWSDREPALPYRVKLYDASGQCRVIADLARYKTIESSMASRPIMPTDIRITWPEIKGVQSHSSLNMLLSSMSTQRKFSDNQFRFQPEGENEMISVDAQYGADGALPVPAGSDSSNSPAAREPITP